MVPAAIATYPSSTRFKFHALRSRQVCVDNRHERQYRTVFRLECPAGLTAAVSKLPIKTLPSERLPRAAFRGRQRYFSIASTKQQQCLRRELAGSSYLLPF